MNAVDINLDENAKMGDIRKLAKEIKINHDLALELWETKNYSKRLLSILIMDKKSLSSDLVDKLVEDMLVYEKSEQTKLMDWLFANQLSKNKSGLDSINSWRDSSLALQRRTFWYYQARLRWMGKGSHEDTEELLIFIENNILGEEAVVQWAMNFLAGWIGVFEENYRDRCIKLGEKTGLYKMDKVSKGCTPDYLPEFIRIEVDKRN